MACATLKRSLDWEPALGSRPAKRRRCGAPFCSGSPTQKDHRTSPTSAPPQIQRPSQHRHTFGGPGPSTSTPITPTKPKSVFPDVLSKKLTPEYMAENIRAELKRLHKRNRLQQHAMENADGSSAAGNENADRPPSRSERALFTFKQVGLICERMLKERESEIREEYDNVLTAKLAEQYDAFVKFTYDQIHKNYSSAAPSYLS